MQVRHYPFYPLLNFPFRICIVRLCIAGSSFLDSGLFFPLFFISFSIILPFPTVSSTASCLFCLSIFTRPILLHIHISNASSHLCSFRRSIQFSAPYNATLNAKHFTSIFHISFSKGAWKMILLLLNVSFAIAILCFTS